MGAEHRLCGLADGVAVIPLVTPPRPLNERLWSLIAKEQDGTITKAETAELNALCDNLETEQDHE